VRWENDPPPPQPLIVCVVGTRGLTWFFWVTLSKKSSTFVDVPSREPLRLSRFLPSRFFWVTQTKKSSTFIDPIVCALDYPTAAPLFRRRSGSGSGSGSNRPETT
jgi:hypothetical protein